MRLDVQKPLTNIVRLMYKSGMHLSNYMELHGLTDAAVAEAIGRSRATVSRIRRRKTRPDWVTIETLRSWSQSAISADDFAELAE